MKADEKRDILRKIILQPLANGSVRYTELEKSVLAGIYPFATINTFRSQFRYLLDNRFIVRTSRGIYKITSKGEKYLDILTHQVS